MIKGSVALYWLLVVVLAVFAIAIRYEAVGSGFFADDYAQLGMLAGEYPLERSPLDLFTFSDGTVHEGQRLIESGFYPWFSDPTLRLSMFRPLASGMIWLDYQLFGREPFGYHVHSVLWWFVLFGVVAGLYRLVLPMQQALLALAFFATDEAHGIALAWVANRCAIVCVAFSVLALILYVRRCEQGGARPAWPIIACTVVSFGFGEYALCIFGYVIAYEWLAVRDDSLRVRARRFAMVAVPALLFLGIRTLFHFTPRGSGVYVDPGSEPTAFALALVQRAPVLIADMLLGLRGEYWTFGFDPWFWRWLDPDILPKNWFDRLHAWRVTHVAIGALACALFGLLGRWLWRWSDNRHLRWLSVGTALSILPVVGSFPSSRLLIVPLIGFCALISAMSWHGLARARWLASAGGRLRALALATTVVLTCAFHLLVSTWLTRGEMVGIAIGSSRMLNAVLKIGDSNLPRQHLVLLAAPEGSTSMYIPLTRWLYWKPVPRSCSTLSLVPSPYKLRRVNDHAFTIEYFKPASMLRTAPEQLLRSPDKPLQVNDVINTGLFRVIVLALQNGLPSRLLVNFDRPLEDPMFRFMTVTNRGIRKFKLPAVGADVIVPSPAVPER